MIRSGSFETRKISRGARLGLLLLALSAAAPGIWALLWPQSFFSDFPGFGMDWVAAHPPFNEHLVRDVGSFYLGFAVLLGLTALSGGARAIRIALVSWLVFSVPHLLWHAQHAVGEGNVDRWGSVAALGAGVLLTLWLLWDLRRRRN